MTDGPVILRRAKKVEGTPQVTPQVTPEVTPQGTPQAERAQSAISVATLPIHHVMPRYRWGSF